MMKTMNPLWLHRIIRLTGGIGFMAIATQYEGSWPLYIFGGIVLISGFIRPRRCYGECDISTGPNGAGGSKK